MTRDSLKKKLRALKSYTPDQEEMLGIAIDEGVQFVWDAHDWSWKRGVATFTASTGTYDLPDNVDTIMELTYGETSKVVQPVTSSRMKELYNNIAKTGNGDVYYYSIYSADMDNLTLELAPTPSGGLVFTYTYLKKIEYGSIEQIPEKLHSLVLSGAMMFMGGGLLDIWPALAQSIVRDMPIKHKRSSMGLDGLMTTRINQYNTILNNGSSQDTTRPYN